MKFLTPENWELLKRYPCERCHERNGCDQVNYYCPLADFNKNTVNEEYYNKKVKL